VLVTLHLWTRAPSIFGKKQDILLWPEYYLRPLKAQIICALFQFAISFPPREQWKDAPESPRYKELGQVLEENERILFFLSFRLDFSQECTLRSGQEQNPSKDCQVNSYDLVKCVFVISALTFTSVNNLVGLSVVVVPSPKCPQLLFS
jgi:hypothetical protein